MARWKRRQAGKLEAIQSELAIVAESFMRSGRHHPPARRRQVGFAEFREADEFVAVEVPCIVLRKEGYVGIV